MPQTDFILNLEEQRKLIEFILGQDVDFIPSINYESRRFDKLNSLYDIEAIIRSNTLTSTFFLPLQKDSPYTIEFGSFKKNDEILYYIAPRQGIPCMDFLPCYHKFDCQPPLYISGFIAYYKSYFQGERGIEVPVTTEVIDLYKRTVKFLRTICISAKTKNIKRQYWIGHNALQDIKSGTSINVDNLEL